MIKQGKSIVLPVLLFLLLSSSCQQEVIEIINPPADEVIAPGSSVADLIQRVPLKDGSADNIIDGASCLTLVLPVTVRIEDDEFRVETEDDLKQIEEILGDQDDEDGLEIVFPVTGILPDYTEIIINDEDEMEDLRKECIENGEDEDIECIDFLFPLTIYKYDAGNQLSEVLAIADDRQLFEFFREFGEDELCSFEFPVVVVLAGNGEVVVGNNDELEALIGEAEDDCDEDDDNDFEDDVNAGQFEEILTTGEWEIKLFKSEQDDKTGSFTDYLFVFNPDGTVEVHAGEEIFYGTWEIELENGNPELDLEFDEDTPLDEISEDWEVIDFDNTMISLVDDSGDDEVLLTFGRK